MSTIVKRGNHYLFSERQRLALVRAVSSNESIKMRKDKEIKDIPYGRIREPVYNSIQVYIGASFRNNKEVDGCRISLLKKESMQSNHF